MIEMDFKNKILEFIKSRKGKPTTTSEILDAFKISYPTLTKWLAVLEAEGKVIVNDYKKIKFYYFKNGEKER